MSGSTGPEFASFPSSGRARPDERHCPSEGKFLPVQRIPELAGLQKGMKERSRRMVMLRLMSLRTTLQHWMSLRVCPMKALTRNPKQTRLVL
ncbi:hypothetical protein HZA45_02725 [Candidatus Peregrinibacteria bacterium]|nr:hypothetical protein [Candidatus Peregrinibacteria bacterium]